MELYWSYLHRSELKTYNLFSGSFLVFLAVDGGKTSPSVPLIILQYLVGHTSFKVGDPFHELMEAKLSRSLTPELTFITPVSVSFLYQKIKIKAGIKKHKS